MATQADFADLLEKQKQITLKFKTKIIQLENQLSYEVSRANEYESKFRDAVLQSQYSSDQGLLEKLSEKQNELSEYRIKVIELNQKISNSNNGGSISNADVMTLARQNQQLAAYAEEIKNAAISAILIKDQQIQQLNKSITKYQNVENELKFQYQKYESLERMLEITINEKDEDIRQLNEKISRQREVFLNKLESFQKEAHFQENVRDQLVQKTQNLVGDLQKNQMMIEQYQKKINQLQNQLNRQKIIYEKEKSKIEIEKQETLQSLKVYQKQNKTLQKFLQQSKLKQKYAQEQVERLVEQNAQLSRKLSIKKRKENKSISDNVWASFSGAPKKNHVFSSFVAKARDLQNIQIESQGIKKNNLAQINELQETDMIENINFEQFTNPNEQQKPINSQKTISSVINEKQSIKASDLSLLSNSEKKQNNNEQINKQLNYYSETIAKLEVEKIQLQANLSKAYQQLKQINLVVKKITNQLQQQRKNTADLRQQMKKTKKESELIVEVQSLTLHVQKLQKDMLSSKLKYAEQVDFAKQKFNRERVAWTQKLVSLTQKIAKQDMYIGQKPAIKTEQKKKKKGFFG